MAAPAPGLGEGPSPSPSPVELWHRRMFVFSVTASLALVAEVGYAQLVPKIPQLYAALIRAAVWDCVLVGVLVAQLVDLASTPLLVGTDGGHYLPLAVLLYHTMKMLFCAAYDGISRSGSVRARSWHRALVCRRVLLELAGGTTGKKLYLGRICFVVSGGAMWLALRALLFLDDGMTVLTCFIVLVLAAYCAAGLAALEPRHSLPGRLVQWLCTGWGAREAVVQGPLKIFGGLFLLPFAASVIAAQIWLRTVAFIVWLAVACPCCRLQRADNVYDAFERELAVPLLQCSFLAFACILAAIVLVSGQLSGPQRTAVGLAAAYYTGMLMLWTAPTVLQAKVANEEAFDTAAALGEEGNAQLLQRDTTRIEGESDIELEDLRSSCDELRALLQRERHDHSVEAGQLQERLRDQECQTRAAERDRAQAKDAALRLEQEIDGWRERCTELKRQLTLQQPQPVLPRLQWPLPAAAERGCEPLSGPDAVTSQDAEGGRTACSASEETSERLEDNSRAGSSGGSEDGGSSTAGIATGMGGAEGGLAGEAAAPSEAPHEQEGLHREEVESAACGANEAAEAAGEAEEAAREAAEAGGASPSCRSGGPELECEAPLEPQADDGLKAEGRVCEGAAVEPAPGLQQPPLAPDGPAGSNAGFATPPESASDVPLSPRRREGSADAADLEQGTAAGDGQPSTNGNPFA